MKPLGWAAIGVGGALAVSAVWLARRRPPVVEPATTAIVSVRIARHDAFGVPGKPRVVRDRVRVRTIVEALDVDGQPPEPCPPDYAAAELGLVLGGRDVYARRDVYVWNLEGSAPRVVVVSSAGCRGGPPGDVAVLRRELGY